MTTKSFQIDWEGAKASIEYEDDITFGELENILSKCLDMSDVQKPKVNIPLYRQLIVTSVLRTAPFQVGEIAEIRNLKLSVANQIMKGVMKDYPLMRYLEEWVGTFIGSEIPDTSEVYTTSSQGNSVGRKSK